MTTRLRFRRLNQFRAWLTNRAWGDCPLCGRMFGGHEWRDGPNGEVSSIPHPDGTPGKGKAICPICTSEGRGRRSDGWVWSRPQQPPPGYVYPEGYGFPVDVPL
jgi:hypothetical protein